MDQERSRIAADLAGLLEGEVDCDPLRVQMYASDASIHEIRPLGVVRPRSVDDVARMARYASENGISLHPRGSGSNVTGAAIGPGLVVDFAAHMRRILAVGDRWARVQPGVVLAALNRELAPQGKFFAPDPHTRSISTVGGVLAMNLSGSHWKGYGSPRDKVLGLQVVLATGEVLNLRSGLHPEGKDATGEAAALERWHGIETGMRDLLQRNAAALVERRPGTPVNQSGYNLFDIGPPVAPDLVRLLIGSEGTLGLVTEATLAIDPLPQHRGVTLLFFAGFDAAVRIGIEIAAGDVHACDLLDRRLLRLAREADPELAGFIPVDAEAMLLVEQQAPTDGQLRDMMERLVARASRRQKGAVASRSTTQTAERNRFWRLVRRIVPSLYQLNGTRRAVPFLEDLAVAPVRLPVFLRELQTVLNRHEVTAATFCHVPQGLVQLYPFLDPGDPADQRLMTRLAVSVADLVISLQGTISGAFGDGLSRSWLVRRQFGPLDEAFAEVKQLFDPGHLLNPGVIVAQPERELTGQMRRATLPERVPAEGGPERSGKEPLPSAALPVIQPELAWDAAEMLLEARSCNGCARCRTTSPEQRMCPVHRVLPREEASPRAKANLMRGILTGQLDPQLVSRDEFRAVADLCFHCHQCRIECPAHVDIPRLMLEAKAQHVQVNGLRLGDWLLSRLDLVYWLGGLAPRLTNAMLSNRLCRWLMDRFGGIAQGRKLPRFSQRSFLGWAIRERLHQGRDQAAPKVAFFVDAFVNWNDLELGEALVKVLRHNGVQVVVPNRQVISGMSLISDGMLARARSLAGRNVELLAEYVRAGYDIVTVEPSAALALRREYVQLLGDPDAQLVAGRVYDACHYLWRLHLGGRLELDFRPLSATVGYHLPCHIRALEVGTPGLQLMRLIPGLVVHTIQQGCSGMAGTWGLKRKNWLRSLRIGRGLIQAVRSRELDAGSTECASCRIQMEQGTEKPTLHPVKILAHAYGLMPQLDGLFSRRSGDLQLS